MEKCEISHYRRNTQTQFVFPIQTESIEKHNSHISLAQNNTEKLCWRISLAGNLLRNTRILLAYFTHREPLEKYANGVGIFHSQGTYREICKLCWHVSLAVNT